MTWAPLRLRLGATVALVVGLTMLGVPAHAMGQRPIDAGPGAQLALSPADVVFPSPTEVMFDMGWVDGGAVVVTVEPKNRNRPNWELFVQASAADMGGKPASDILVRAEGSPLWTSLGTTPALMADGTGVATVTIHFRLLLDLSLDAPGTYSVPLEYTSSTY